MPELLKVMATAGVGGRLLRDRNEEVNPDRKLPCFFFRWSDMLQTEE
jgi:hypothetical protein